MSRRLIVEPQDAGTSSASEEDSNSSEEASSTDGGHPHLKPIRRFLVEKFRQGRWILVISLTLEVVLCLLMTLWARAHLAFPPPEHSGLLFEEYFETRNIVVTIWSIFSICLFGRIVCALDWKFRYAGLPDRVYAAFFMLFSSLQWVPYLAMYLLLKEELTTLVRESTVDIKYAADITTSAAWKLANGEQVPPGHIFEFLTKTCQGAKRNDTLCEAMFRPTCVKPFSFKCRGSAFIGYEDSGSGDRCCVDETLSLQVKGMDFGFGEVIDVQSVFTAAKFMAVIAMSWSLMDAPFLDEGSVFGYSSFAQGVWLDILDAVMFSDYVVDDKVRLPAYGISLGPTPRKGASVPADGWPRKKVWLSWIFGLSTAILTPIVYIICQRTGGTEADEVKAQTIDEVSAKLMKSIGHLDSEAAHKLADEALRLQYEHYSKMSPDEQLVKVVSDSHVIFDTFGALKGSSRPGRARWSHSHVYTVTYTDGELPAEEEVPVDRISPDVEAHSRGCGPGCISGWLHCSYLTDESPRETFERRATLIDAWRSLLLLEGPFLIWRLHFEWDAKTTNVLLLKNFVWALHDVLLILACANENAVFLNHKPIRFISSFLRGTRLAQIFVLPSAVVHLGAQLATNAVSRKVEWEKKQLTLQKAWLLVERSRGFVTSAYDRELQRVEDRLKVLARTQKLVHT